MMPYSDVASMSPDAILAYYNSMVMPDGSEYPSKEADAKLTEIVGLTKNQFMQVIPVFNLSSVFSDKMYFWPIAHTELKRNKNLVQNPGWTYND